MVDEVSGVTIAQADGLLRLAGRPERPAPRSWPDAAAHDHGRKLVWAAPVTSGQPTSVAEHTCGRTARARPGVDVSGA